MKNQLANVNEYIDPNSYSLKSWKQKETKKRNNLHAVIQKKAISKNGLMLPAYEYY